MSVAHSEYALNKWKREKFRLVFSILLYERNVIHKTQNTLVLNWEP